MFLKSQLFWALMLVLFVLVHCVINPASAHSQYYTGTGHRRKHERRHGHSKKGGPDRIPHRMTSQEFEEYSGIPNLRNLLLSYDDDTICYYPTLVDIITNEINGEEAIAERCGDVRGHYRRSGPKAARIRARRTKSKRNHKQKSKGLSEKDKTKLDRLLKKTRCKLFTKLIHLTPKPEEEDRKENPFMAAFNTSESYYPCEVPVKRCDGCCQSELMECVATKVKERTFKVLKITNHNRLGLQSRNSNPLEKIRIEEHKRCQCKCKTRASDCGPGQTYDRNNCHCQCPKQSYTLCSQSKIWSEHKCKCICKNRTECTTGMEFNEDSCRCETSQTYLDSSLFEDLT